MLGKIGIAAGFLLAAVVPALADSQCVDPVAPSAIDGNTATKEQMKAAHDDVMNFIKSSDDFQDCVDAEYKQQQQQATKDKKKLDPQVATDVDAKLNANQHLKEKVGAEYNASVLAYKAAHPGG